MMVNLARLTALVSGLCLLVAATVAIGQANESQAELVKRGAHLARIADCTGCHTPKGGAEFSGNGPMESPFGTFYAQNITQDKQTGIGDWTYADFKRALHEGISKDGSYIYPAMPFVSYTHLKDEDVKALWAYFKTIKPVRNKARDPDLVLIGQKMSHTARLALFGWRLPYFKARRFEPDPNRSAEYNKGAYYVHALGHCSSCHTPRNMAFAQERGQMLNGFVLNGWYAPRISPGPDSAIKHWSVDQLATYLKKGELGKQSIAVGPMHEVWKDSLRHLPYSDLHAMAVYLKNMPRHKPQSAPAKARISAEEKAQGRAIYQLHCQTCHQADGQGMEGVAPALAGNNLVFADQSNSVVMAILQGFDPKNVWGAMPSYAGTLNDQQIAAVSNYVRTAWNNDASADATVAMVRGSRPHAAKDIPLSGQRAAVVCPNLQASMIRPALQFGDQTLLSSFSDRSKLAHIVSRYQTAHESGSIGDAVKGLTAAYCRALVAQDGTSISERDNRIFQYSQRVAEVAARGR